MTHESIEFLGHRQLMIAMLNIALLDIRSNDPSRRDLAIKWLDDRDQDYEWSFTWIISMLAGYVVRDQDLERIKRRMKDHIEIQPERYRKRKIINRSCVGRCKGMKYKKRVKA